jgi:hypothetical protein
MNLLTLDNREKLVTFEHVTFQYRAVINSRGNAATFYITHVNGYPRVGKFVGDNEVEAITIELTPLQQKRYEDGITVSHYATITEMKALLFAAAEWMLDQI